MLQEWLSGCFKNVCPGVIGMLSGCCKNHHLEPHNARYHNSRTVILDELGRYEESLEEKSQAVQLEPDNVS